MGSRGSSVIRFGHKTKWMGETDHRLVTVSKRDQKNAMSGSGDDSA